MVSLDQFPHTSMHDAGGPDNHGDAQNQVQNQHVDVDNDNDIVVDEAPV